MAASSFKRPHHNRIAQVLQAFNPQVLDRCGCFFGGGTAIALAFGEFRESVDIDFLVSDLEGFREIRELMTGPNGLAPILKPGAHIELAREVRSSQYKVETMLKVDGMPIKFEIVLEGHIQLDPSSTHICGIRTLGPVDMLATKLMANSDRLFADDTRNRDLIDMAMMQPSKAVMAKAAAKVRQTIYKNSFEPNLAKAIARVQEREGWLETCLKQMQITVPRACVLELIKKLSPPASELSHH